MLRIESRHVYYGTGGDHHYFCELKTFRRWAHETDAKLAVLIATAEL